MNRRHVCPVWVGYLLANPARALFQNPEKILAPHVAPGMRVLDVGCAMGFFSLPLARLVGPGGRVICVDLQQTMLDSLARRARRAHLLDRIEIRRCDADSLRIPDLHGQILAPSYASTPSLWRPMNEMKVTVMYLSVLIAALCFVLVYVLFFARRGVSIGLRYGVLFGVGAGVSMGYGSYSVMPIPYHMALTWFMGTVIEAAVGGVLLGAIVCEERAV